MFNYWKLVTWTAGMAVLMFGAYLNIAPDWDYGVSIIMGTLTLLTAQRSVQALVELEPKQLLWAIFNIWFVVDGAYVMYWFVINREALMMRDIQWPVSLYMYLMCGIIWSIHDPKPLSDALKSRYQLLKGCWGGLTARGGRDPK